MPQRRKTPAPRVISVVVESRRRAPDGPLFGAEAWVALEQLIRDAYAFAGIDADAPMRRDLAVVVRRGPTQRKQTKRKQRKR